MADQPIPEQQQQLNIELSEEMADGEYANLAIITHSFAEFVIAHHLIHFSFRLQQQTLR